MARIGSAGVDIDLERARGGSTIRCAIRGNITLAEIPRLTSPLRAAREHPGADMAVDLSRGGFIDSSGVGLLMGLRGAVESAGGRFSVATVSDRSRQSLERLGLADRILNREAGSKAA